MVFAVKKSQPNQTPMTDTGALSKTIIITLHEGRSGVDLFSGVLETYRRRIKVVLLALLWPSTLLRHLAFHCTSI